MRIIATSFVLLVAFATLMLQRAAFAASTTPYMVTVLVIVAAVVIVRASIELREVRIPRYWLPVVCVASYGCAVWMSGVSALEEHLQVALLCIASTLLALSASSRTDAWVAAIAVLLVLLGMPVLHEHQRTTITAAAVACVTLWCFVTHSSAVAFAWRPMIKGVALAGAMAGVVYLADQVIRPTDGNPSYAAFVPASGGDDAGSDTARTGVGEGPDEIAGNSPDSIGFDNTDTFSESGRDGLYDLWLESFGQPLQPDQTQKMIGLKPKDVTLAAANDQENLRVGRKFEMHRAQRPGPKQARSDVAATAAVMLKGPLPAYVPLTAFDSYDNAVWSESPITRQIVPVRKLPDSTWMEILLRPLSPAFDGEDGYQVRVGSLGGRVLPLPMHVERLRMGRVSRPEFFQSTRWGGVELAKRDVPAGAVIDVICKRVDPTQAVRVEPAQVGRSKLNHLDASELSAGAHRLAADWAGERERGWGQILAVVTRLRNHGEHVAAHQVPPGEDPIDNLLRERRGTSYQFATSAALMLRSVGYPTRVASGFFASVSEVDPRSGFAMLDARHTHFWCEVGLADGTWIAVDATPGYPLLEPPGATYELLSELGARLVGGVRERWYLAAAVVMLLGAAGVARRRIVDMLATAWCVARGRTPTAVLCLVELRAKLSGKPRPQGMPVGRWLRSVDQSATVLEFIHAVNVTLYGKGGINAPVARDAMRSLTLQRFRNHARGTHG